MAGQLTTVSVWMVQQRLDEQASSSEGKFKVTARTSAQRTGNLHTSTATVAVEKSGEKP
jgi:hypothetical protein